MSFYDQFQFHLNLYLILVSFKLHSEGCLLRLWTGCNPNFKTPERYSTYPDVGSPAAGLSLLAKIIAFDLIARESCYENSKKPSYYRFRITFLAYTTLSKVMSRRARA